MTPEPRLPASRHNYGWTSQRAQNFIWKPLLYSAEKLLKFCNVGAIKGGASWYGCMVLVRRWCVQYGVLVWLRCMRVRVVPIPSASLPLFYLQTRRSETFRWGLLVIPVIPRYFRWMITTDLVQRHLSSANKGGEYLKCYLLLRKNANDSASYRSGFGSRRSAEQIIEQTSHCQERIPRLSTKLV